MTSIQRMAGMALNKTRSAIYDLVKNIEPLDTLEQEQQSGAVYE